MNPYEWLTNRRLDTDARPPACEPPYGDITAYNEKGLIKTSVGTEALRDVTSDLIDLLETSVAIYEKNGDYAYGIFASGWCRLMDCASRALCHTDDNREALESGLWLCHENCWRDSAKAAMESGKATDIPCVGGIRLAAEPIRAGGGIIGCINLGYGNPPRDRRTIEELAARFGVSTEKLAAAAAGYDPRPPFLTDLAKKRLASVARTIGEIVERTLARREAEESTLRLALALENASAGSWEWDPATGFLRVDAPSLKMMGFPPDEPAHPAEEWLARLVPEDRENLNAAVGAVLSGKAARFHTEFRAWDRSGDLRWYTSSGRVARRDDSGRALSLVGIHQDVTDRRRSEEALRRSREREHLLADILEKSAQPFATGGVDGTLGITNQAFRSLIGYSEEEMATADWKMDLTPPEWRPVEAGQHERLLATGRPVRYEKEFLRKDGTRVPVEMLVHVMPSEDGKPGMLYAFATDLTERKSAEQALRKSESLFRKVFDILPVGLWIADKNGKLQQGNPKGVEIWGASPLVDQPNYGVFKARHLPSGEEIAPEDWALAHTVNEGATVEDELLEIDAFDGVTRTILNYTAPVLDEHGEVEAAIVVNHDITELRRTEEARRESAEKLLAVAENLETGIVLLSPDLRVLEMNRKMREWFPDVHPGDQPMCHTSFHTPECAEPCSGCPVLRTLEDGKPHELVRETERDGETRSYRLLSSPVRDAQGRITSVIEMREDISGRLQLEAQLRQAQKMEAVGRLAGGVAHDFNNMLGVITGYAEIAMTRLSPADPTKRDLEEIYKAALRSADLTSQLLAFARRQSAVPRVLKLNAVIERNRKMMHRLLGEDVELLFTPAPDLWSVRMDPSQVDQVLANLLVNARDALEGGGTIRIRTANQVLGPENVRGIEGLKPGEYVLLSIHDNGAGMDADTMERIFEPFFTTKGEGKGTGLGLSTVFGVIRQNRGGITVTSGPGIGTEFSIWLPRHVGEEAKETTGVDEVPEGTETVLVVEDEEQMLRLCTRFLQRLGYTVLAAGTPAGALAKCREHKEDIHLLVTDVVMPTMNGRDLARRIEKLKPGIRILYMSGYTADIIAHHGVLADGFHFLQKPFTLAPLARKVRSVLDENTPAPGGTR